MKLELTEQDTNNLMNFLNRTTIQGSEVAVFLPLVQKIQRQIQSQQTLGPQQMRPAPKPEKLNKPEKDKK